MTKHLISTLFFIFFLGSCTPVPASPTSTPVATVSPTRTPRPTQTAIPTATPYPQLQTEGPYLLFTYDNKNFTILDADGSGRKQFQLPNDGYVWELEKAVSPDGKWLAYFTGSTEEPYDLALNILNLLDGSSKLIADLIAPNFPENLLPVIETTQISEYDTDCFNDMACQLEVVERAFKFGIRNITWSPNSQEFAFAAQIDGPSSDIYIHRVGDNSRRRLTNDLENIAGIEWAPNGEKILYQNSLPGRVYVNMTLQIADPQSELIQDPKSIYGGAFWSSYGWINENSYLIRVGGDGGPQNHHIQFIDLNGRQKILWPYSAESVAIDSQNQIIILSTSPFGIEGWQPEPEAGVYFVSMDAKFTFISNETYSFFENQDPFNVYFALDDNDQLVSIGLNGLITPLERHATLSSPPRVSPNGNWVFITSDKGGELYSNSLQLIRSWDISPTITLWSADSTGALLYTYRKLYYLSIPDGEPLLIDSCDPKEKECDHFSSVWLP